MVRKSFVVGWWILAVGCASERTENSAICGITMLASATRIVDQLSRPHVTLTTPPPALVGGPVAARVVGYGTSRAIGAEDENGQAVIGYDGQGFPASPGFGVALVDDSSEVFRGVLIWDKEPPPEDYPRIGTISDLNATLPLIGMRINWGSVNSERCPIFANLDSLP